MLVIVKRLNEPIKIGDAIVKITQNRYTLNSINIVIDAPQHIRVDRLEADTIKHNLVEVDTKQKLVDALIDAVSQKKHIDNFIEEALNAFSVEKLAEMKVYYGI